MTINAWGSEDPAEVAKGGTGNATLTDHGVLLGSGTAAVTVTAAATDGQLLIGNTGADPAVAAPTGDTDEIAIGLGSGTLSIGIADDPVLPGNESVTIPAGTTAQEPSAVNGMLRYDSDTDMLRGVINSAWVDITTGGGGGGAYVFLNQQTPSGASAITWDNTYITSTYDQYAVFWFGLTMASAGGTNNLILRVSNDNGASYHTTGYRSDWSSTVIAGGASAAYMMLAAEFQRAGSAGAGSGYVLISAPTTAGVITTSFSNGLGYTNSKAYGTTGPGVYATTEANNAIQILPDNGNTFSGTFRLYGISAA